MQPKSTLRSFLFLAGSSLLTISSASAQSDPFRDVNGGTAGTGGTGNWNASNTWRTGSDTITLTLPQTPHSGRFSRLKVTGP